MKLAVQKEPSYRERGADVRDVVVLWRRVFRHRQLVQLSFPRVVRGRHRATTLTGRVKLQTTQRYWWRYSVSDDVFR